MSERLVINIDGDASGLTAALNSANNRLNSFNQRVTNSSRNLTRLQNQINSLGAALGSVATAATAAATGMNRVNAGAAAAGAGVQRLNRHTNGLSASLKNVVISLASLQTVFFASSLFLGSAVRNVIRINAEYERMTVLLKNLSKATTDQGKMKEAGDNLNYIWNMAENAPFSVESLTDSFVKFRAAGLDPTNGSLQGLVDSVAAFGGSSEQLKRAAVAIQQMGGKGVISMEELRQQLGEAVPDAMQMMSQAMGMTMRDFVKTVSEGTVASGNALQKMFDEMRRRHGDAAKGMMNTWSGLTARLQTAWTKFVIKVTNDGGENSFFNRLKQQINDLTKFLNTPAGEGFARDVSETFGKIVVAISDAIKWFYEYRDTIITVAKIFAVMWGARFINGIFGNLIRAFGSLFAITFRVINGFNQLRNAVNGVAVVTQLFGNRTTAAARSLGVFNAAGQISISALARIASSAVIAAGAFAAFAAAVWLVVRALNAKAAAEQRTRDLDKAYKNGETFASEQERIDKSHDLAKVGNRLLKEDENLKRQEAKYGKNDPLVRAARARWRQRAIEYNKEKEKFQVVAARTDQAALKGATANWSMEIGDKLDKQSERIRQNHRNRLNEIDKMTISEEEKAKKRTASMKQTEESLIAVYTEQEAALGKVIDANAKTNLAKAEGAREQLKRIQEQKQAAIEGLSRVGTENDFLAPKGDGKKPKGPKSDGLDGLRSRWVSLQLDIARVQHEILNPGEEFEDWELEEKLRALAETLGSSELRQGVNLFKNDLIEIRKTAKVDDTIKDIRDEALNMADESAAGLASIEAGFDSLAVASDNYLNSLTRQHREELDIALARKNNPKYTQFEQEQYDRLSKAIGNAVRQKEIEMLVDRAKANQQKNEEFTLSLMTKRQREEYLYAKEKKRLEEEIEIALRKRSDAVQELIDAEKELNWLEFTGNTEQIRNQEIIVTGYKEAADAAARAIPHAEERLRQLEQERRIAQNTFGAWALEAHDTKAAMDDMLVGALDNFVNDLAEGKLAFADFAKAIISDLIKIIIRAYIAKAILTALGLGGGSATASSDPIAMAGGGELVNTVSASYNHSGGIAGKEGRTGYVDAAMFEYAKRYHSGGFPGLAPNEVPIIAEKGEGVFTKEQMKALGGNTKGSNVQVNVINQTGTPAEVERKAPRWDGEKMIEDIILKKLSTPGPVRDAIIKK